jgi:hypothetical protein
MWASTSASASSHQAGQLRRARTRPIGDTPPLRAPRRPRQRPCQSRRRPWCVDRVYIHSLNDPMPARSRLTLCNCFAVRQASRHVTKIYDRHLAPARITIAQFTLLALLDERSEMTMNDLVKAVMIDRTTLVRTVKPLQRDQLVTSRPNPKDVRQLVFSLTSADARG